MTVNALSGLQQADSSYVPYC